MKPLHISLPIQDVNQARGIWWTSKYSLFNHAFLVCTICVNKRSVRRGFARGERSEYADIPFFTLNCADCGLHKWISEFRMFTSFEEESIYLFIYLFHQQHVMFIGETEKTWGFNLSLVENCIKRCKSFIIIYFEKTSISSTLARVRRLLIWSPSTHPWIPPIQDVNQALSCHHPHTLSKSSFSSPHISPPSPPHCW